MRKNKVKQIWTEGNTAVNGWLHIPSSWSAEVMAHQGFDSLVVDMQHGMMGIDMAIIMLQAVSTTDVVPMVRVMWNEPGQIGKMLDAGAMGIICPMVNSREECEQFVGACRYFPDGYRSLGPTRAQLYAGADYPKEAKNEVITMAMIETETAVNNAEAIISVPGLDAIYIGPGDLSLTIGSDQRMDNTDPNYLEKIKHVVDVCKKHNVMAGLHTGSSVYAREMRQMGFQFVTLSSDTGMLSARAKEMVQNFHDGGETAVSGSVY